jgi:hypothetical protein
MDQTWKSPYTYTQSMSDNTCRKEAKGGKQTVDRSGSIRTSIATLDSFLSVRPQPGLFEQAYQLIFPDGKIVLTRKYKYREIKATGEMTLD